MPLWGFYTFLLFGTVSAYQVTPCLNGIQSNYLRDLQDGVEIRTTKLHLSRIDDTSDSTVHSPHLCNISLNTAADRINLTFSPYVTSTLYYCPKVNNNPHYWAISEKSGPICNIQIDNINFLPVPVTFSWKSYPITEFNITFEADEIITITPGEFDVLTLTTLVATTGDTSGPNKFESDYEMTTVYPNEAIKAEISIWLITVPVVIGIVLLLNIIIIIVFIKHKRDSKLTPGGNPTTEDINVYSEIENDQNREYINVNSAIENDPSTRNNIVYSEIEHNPIIEYQNVNMGIELNPAIGSNIVYSEIEHNPITKDDSVYTKIDNSSTTRETTDVYTQLHM